MWKPQDCFYQHPLTLASKKRCRSLFCVVICVLAAASKEMSEPIANLTERLGEDGWCIFGGVGVWASNCAIARRTRDPMSFPKTLLGWSSSHMFTLFSITRCFQFAFVCFVLFFVPSCRRYCCWFVKWGLKMNTGSLWTGPSQRLSHFDFLTIAL